MNIRYLLLNFLILSSLTSSIIAQVQVDKIKSDMPKFGGRILYDLNFIKGSDSVDVAEAEFRAIRIKGFGRISENIKYKAEFEFVKGKIQYRDLYIQFLLPQKGSNIKIGSFTEPTNLDMNISLKFNTFTERPFVSMTQNFKYGPGIMYTQSNLLNTQLGLQMAYTFNNDKQNGFFANDLKGGGNFIARLTRSFFVDKNKHNNLHLGVNYEYRKGNLTTKSYGFKPENHLGYKFNEDFFGVYDHTQDLGFEVALTRGSLGVQAEYEHSTSTTSISTYNTQTYYIQASYFFTKEYRPYKNGAFKRVKVIKPFSFEKKQWGALQVAARISAVDFRDNPNVELNPLKGILNISGALNWHLVNNMRIMYNFIHTKYETNLPIVDATLNTHIVRFQLDF